MAINPSTEIRLYTNIPFDKNREHTYKFDTTLAQQSYFGSQSLDYDYFQNNVRVNPSDDTIRVPVAFKRARQYNYVAFINADYGYEGKWYYAFVDYAEYLNNNVTLLHISLDYMQTYLLDFDVLPSLVEREHTKTDKYGEHIVPEGLEIGDPILNHSLRRIGSSTPINPNGYIPTHFMDKFGYVVFTVKDVKKWSESESSSPSLDDFKGGTTINNITYPYQVLICPDAEGLVDCLFAANFHSSADAVVAVFTYPLSLIDWEHCVHFLENRRAVVPRLCACGVLYDDKTLGYTVTKSPKTTESISFQYIRHIGQQPTTVNVRDALYVPLAREETTGIDGYVPFNNKLYSAPFSYFEISDNAGHCCVIRQELFSPTANLVFQVFGNLGANPTVMLAPLNYRKLYKQGEDLPDYESGLVSTDIFDIIPWTTDRYQQWLVANGGKLALAVAGGAISMVNPVLGATIGSVAISTMDTSGQREQSVQVQNRGAGGRFASGTHTETQMTDIPSSHINTTKRVRTGKVEAAMGVASGLVSTASVLADIGAHATLPLQVNGQINNGSLNTSVKDSHLADFFIRLYTVRNDYAKRIDNFFSRYGYAVNEFKIPNVFDNVDGVPRPRWNYVKTTDVKVVAKTDHYFDADAEENIEAIINRGITFWNPSVTIGDYTQTAAVNNKPTA